MQSVSSRIWTRVAVSFSYDDNHGHLQMLWVHIHMQYLNEYMNPQKYGQYICIK